ncbi:hypothetical protein OFB51_25615, partial [Escherichia coli]|nr:hypothetical protein [Escherichia coli]
GAGTGTGLLGVLGSGTLGLLVLATLGGMGQLICDAVIMALCTLKVLTLSTLFRRPRGPISFSSSDNRGDGGPITAGDTVEIGETAPGANAEL